MHSLGWHFKRYTLCTFLKHTIFIFHCLRSPVMGGGGRSAEKMFCFVSNLEREAKTSQSCVKNNFDIGTEGRRLIYRFPNSKNQWRKLVSLPFPPPSVAYVRQKFNVHGLLAWKVFSVDSTPAFETLRTQNTFPIDYDPFEMTCKFTARNQYTGSITR